MSEKQPEEITQQDKQEKYTGWRRKAAAATMGAVALGGLIEATHPKYEGEGMQTVEAATEDEAIEAITGAEDIPLEARREFAESTDAPGVYVTAEEVNTSRDFNPFNNQPEWHQEEKSDQ